MQFIEYRQTVHGWLHVNYFGENFNGELFDGNYLAMTDTNVARANFGNLIPYYNPFKMKHVVLLVLFALFVTPDLSAQAYFPEGAIWHYQLGGFSGPGVTFTTIESKGDSIFNGDTLTYLEGTVFCSVGNNELIKQVGDQILRLNTCDSSYSLLYDFGAVVGDTITIPADICQFNDTNRLVIDSIIPININGVIRDEFFTTYLPSSGGIWFGGSIIEGIGNTFSFYPSIGFCDPAGGPLRCYSDSVIGEYKTGVAGGVCDSISLGMQEEFLDERSVYPNPTNGIVHIERPHELLAIRLFNTNGETLKMYRAAATLDISYLKNGLYYLEFIGTDNSATKKLVKVP